MTETPLALLAQAKQLEKKLRDQQAELVERQKTLDRTLREQSERLRATERERLEERARSLERLALAREQRRETKQARIDSRRKYSEMQMHRERLEAEAKRERLEMEVRRERALQSSREVLVFRWIWQMLGVFLIALLLLSLIDLRNIFLGGIAAAVLALQITAYLRERSAREDLKSLRGDSGSEYER